jgi:hypothetical protein
MPVTYKKIATLSVTTATQAALEFTNIPGAYTDLVILASTRSNRASVAEDIKIEFNGVSTNQTLRTLSGNGSTANSTNDTLIYAWSVGNSATASTFGNWQAYITNYTSSNSKAVSIDAVGENNATTAYQALAAGRWNDSAAVTSIKLLPYTGPDWLQYSTSTLYGISKS